MLTAIIVADFHGCRSEISKWRRRPSIRGARTGRAPTARRAAAKLRAGLSEESDSLSQVLHTRGVRTRSSASPIPSPLSGLRRADDAGMLGVVVYRCHRDEAALGFDQGSNGLFLTRSDLQDQVSPGLQEADGLLDQAAHHL